MNFNGKTVLVYGLGISGRGIVRLLHQNNISMVLYDANVDLDTDAFMSEYGLKNTRFIKGSLKAEDLEGIDILALSPGISINAPDIKMAENAGLEILGEIEIAYQLSKGRIAAITGTNGKTTTTALVGEILGRAFPETFVVGNIGRSFASVADQTTENSVLAAEISSFQLESIKEFHPVVTAILNVTPDHLDRHGNMETYLECKMRIAENQTEDEVCVINYDDELLRNNYQKLRPEVVFFSRLTKLDKGVCLDGRDIILATGNEKIKVCSRDELLLMGDHNVENVCAAIAVTYAMGVDLETISQTVKEFRAVEHRIEYVCTKRGVAYYNDSKGTNTDAAQKAVDSMVAPTVLIAGGYDKGADFTDWINGFNGRVRDMILIGQTAEKIRDTALKCGFTNVHMAADLAEAVKMAAEIADSGDAVLLSPACASWGQFKNYEQRGTMFKEFARALPE
ncbi:MAG: UDP-N-acetylmuramoyl-L-alanine--D-glutamate ligase [Lachnospiraceae bacterium]|nr:UDP-N-acetylmuramoyl-L-alanine--D-glutamate ligase [Lachnospiraceae bacterium]